MKEETLMRVPCDLFDRAATEIMCERYGNSSVVVLLYLMANAAERGETGRATGSTAALAKSAFVTKTLAVGAVNLADEVGYLKVKHIDRETFDVRLLSPIFVPRRRPPIPRRLRKFIFERDNYVCGICQKPIEPGDAIHVDHIFPWSKGGSDEPDNLQAAHGSCNVRKGARI